MPELSLDDRQRRAFACELDSMRMPQLMRREPPPTGAARRARRWLTTAARASVRRSRRTAHRPAARPGRRATERDDRPTPTRPSPPPGGDSVCLGESGSSLGAGRDRTRSATRSLGSAVRRATAPRSAPGARARASQAGLGARRRRSHRPLADQAGRPALVSGRLPGVVAGPSSRVSAAGGGVERQLREHRSLPSRADR
jgi:hypothetical protein